MAYSDTHCPGGGHKQPETMLCPGCETHLAQRPEKRVLSDPTSTWVAYWEDIHKSINNLLIDTPISLVSLASLQRVHRGLPAIRDVISQLEANASAQTPPDSGTKNHG